MLLLIHEDRSPLAADADGVVRAAGTRVPLATVVAAFVAGATPEQIALHYPAVSLASAYATIAYYLRHRAEVDAYLADQSDRGQAVRREVEAHGGRIDVRSLLARRRPATS